MAVSDDTIKVEGFGYPFENKGKAAQHLGNLATTVVKNEEVTGAKVRLWCEKRNLSRI